jgi:signal transduction histidine kinase
MIAAQDKQRAQGMIQAIMTGGAGFQGRKYNAVKKDGTIFPVLIYSTLNTDADGEMGLRGIIIDVSEQEKLAQEKAKLEEQYNQSQKIEAVGRLAGGVAHDLNNMLSPIIGYGELLLDGMPTDDLNRHAVEQIYNAGQRAKDMVRQLLAFSRKQALEIKSINIYQVLAGFEKLLDRILRDDVKLELKLSRGIPNILADAGQMEQVVMNLAINAQDAMPDGGKITIEVGTVLLEQEDVALYAVASPGLYVVITFSDTGHGMTPEIQERIFDPFFTTKGQGKGTGLGLATVYGIIKQHNGSIRVYSEPGTGTVFNIYFPAALSESEQIPENVEKKEGLKGTETILVVEDNDAVRGLAENILNKSGYQTICVSGGAACMALLAHRQSFDMLLTDVVLQDTNGKELYHKVKALCPDIKVLYMSGYTDDVIVHHGVLEEGISFIQKPFSVQGLLRKVRQVLDTI